MPDEWEKKLFLLQFTWGQKVYSRDSAVNLCKGDDDRKKAFPQRSQTRRNQPTCQRVPQELEEAPNPGGQVAFCSSAQNKISTNSGRDRK